MYLLHCIRRHLLVLAIASHCFITADRTYAFQEQVGTSISFAWLARDFYPLGNDSSPVLADFLIVGSGTGVTTIIGSAANVNSVEPQDPLNVNVLLDQTNYDISITDVDPDLDFADGLGETISLPGNSSSITASYTATADPSQPNFGATQQLNTANWTRGTTITLPIDFNGNGALDEIFIPDTTFEINLTDPVISEQGVIVHSGSGIDTSPWIASLGGATFTVQMSGNIQIAELFIEPTLTLPGDFDEDGDLDVDDIDLLNAELKSGNVNPAFDVNGDGEVNKSDLVFFVEDESRLNTWVGDANLDGEFNSGDLVDVFVAGLYETGMAAGWQEGDWNGDGVFDSGDFVDAFVSGGYELGPRGQPEGEMVPEPSLKLLLICGLLAACRSSRSSRSHKDRNPFADGSHS